MSTVVKWLPLLFLMSCVAHASSDLMYSNRTELIQKIEALQSLIENQKALRQSQVTLLNQSLDENNISNGTTVASHPALNSTKAECSYAIFAGSLFLTKLTKFSIHSLSLGA